MGAWGYKEMDSDDAQDQAYQLIAIKRFLGKAGTGAGAPKLTTAIIDGVYNLTQPGSPARAHLDQWLQAETARGAAYATGISPASTPSPALKIGEGGKIVR